MKAKGSFDLLGPSTKAALEAVSRGVPPEEAGKSGATNGAAMRITPVGVAFPASPGALPRPGRRRPARSPMTPPSASPARPPWPPR